MGIEEYSKGNESSAGNNVQSASSARTNWKNASRRKNYKQIFILSFDALRERKARSALTILMVVVGGALMVAL
ncbi:MAG: hypothetical protein WA395_01970, partial [Nitrososphaeraceae archaeon]